MIPGREVAERATADGTGTDDAPRGSGRGRRRRLGCLGAGLTVALSLVAAPVALAAGAHGRRPARGAGSSSAKVRQVLLPVWALLDGQTPVSGARVSVFRGINRAPVKSALIPVKAGSVRTNGAGEATLVFAQLPRAFTVVVDGGRVLTRPLHGSLAAQVRGYRAGPAVHHFEAGPIVHVNPVTTLIEAWRRVNPHVSVAHAQKVIDRALGIPRWADAIDLSINDKWLDGKIFLRDVRAHGTVDRATGALIVRIRRGKHVVTFRAPPSHVARTAGLAEWWADTDVTQLVKDGLSSLGQGVGQSIGGAGFEWALAKFLEAVGLPGYEKFVSPITYMIKQLDAIAGQVTQVKGLVEVGIQATEHSQYNEQVAAVRPIESSISSLWEEMGYNAKLAPSDPQLQQLNNELIAKIGLQLVDNRDAITELHLALKPAEPLSYGILQSASSYLGSLKPFYTQGSARAMQAVFDYYQLMQLRLATLLSNYYSTPLHQHTAEWIKDRVIDKISNDIADERTVLKPPLPPGSFIDLRTDHSATPMLWQSPEWVNGGTLEHYCVDQRGVRHRFFLNVSQLTCDPPSRDSARVGTALATEDQFKALLDGWQEDTNSSPKIETPLAWLQKKTGLAMTAAPDGTAKDHVGFYWVGRAGTPANRAGPVEGPYCRAVCFDDNTLGMYEYLYRYDFRDTSRPSPDEWVTSLFDLDPWNYNANAVLAPKPVAAGEYFWPVGGAVEK